MDKIIIKGLKIFAYHGVHGFEKENGQNFILDMELGLSLKTPGITDNVEDTVSYSDITKTAVKAFTDCKYNLIEKAAARVAEEILKEYPAVKTVAVCVKKPEAPVKADFDCMAVEITRTAADIV